MKSEKSIFGVLASVKPSLKKDLKKEPRFSFSEAKMQFERNLEQFEEQDIEYYLSPDKTELLAIVKSGDNHQCFLLKRL